LVLAVLKHLLEVTTTEITAVILLLFHKLLQVAAGVLVKMQVLPLTLAVLVAALALLTLVRTQLRGWALRGKELKVVVLLEEIHLPQQMMLVVAEEVLLAPE
jgi:hypothetical protein